MKRILYLLVLALAACGKKPESVKPAVSDISESVYASGKIKAENQYTVFPTVSGILMHALVEAGDSVSIGDTLFVIDNLTSRLNSENALAILDLTRENSLSGSDKLRELEVNLEMAYEKYQTDSSLFRRQQRLWDQGIGSKVELEQRELAFAASRASWQSASLRLSDIKSQLKTELKRAQIGYDISKKSANDFVIRSQVNGRVFQVLKEENEVVSPQSALAVIGQPDAFVIELQVDEYDVVKVKPAQDVVVRMDAYKGRIFHAEITSIDPILNDRTRTFKAEAHFREVPELLYPNLTAEANIVLSSRSGALIIPRRFLSEGKYVYTSPDEKTEVITGITDYEKVEILSGIDSSATIYLPPLR